MCFRHWIEHSSAGAKVRQATTLDQLIELFEKQGGRCALTDVKLKSNASIDHIVPRSRGGTDDISNLRWVSWLANKMKGTQTDEELF
jgi:CRISPR/Cas system Type II protein with McrA/HNH and RuvC-like nuclease domain